MPHAVITGASRRLGLFVTEKLLDMGWHVSTLSRAGSDELNALAQERLSQYSLDYANTGAVTAACLSMSEKPVDFVLHNASYFQKNATEVNESHAQLQDMLYVHVALPQLINELLAPALLKSENANIVHMTDIYVSNPSAEYANYCAAKAALENLSLSYAKRLAPKVRVNSIQPGALMFLPDHTEAAKTQVLEQSLLKIEAGFEPIWQTIQYFINTPFLTGTPIKVDGGRSISR